mmetsp:Transcript_18436/g.53158  ORF Transcript_18436/g.53158 Transcript_18436/m.53158 type:complete len:319 (-) Transcript_18436:167-1123(-)|eukprot:CAMPEP_0113562098 /NCGR_PEP_ID=MMETSP0015_2-20120614/20341_1 /TAXON_ID=2838 /ORGANISM="Odontella" /LENGTH=318 /DNA_ID=CAMNT_0000463963 /DNA_START=184 /DNA_END=1140 /DNA_ORIENTATION=+ /assembly_acc=CAM_ASM_000160
MAEGDVAAQATDGIDVPSKLKESSSEDSEGGMSDLVKLAQCQSVGRGNMAEEGVLDLRREYGARGTSSLVVIHNRTAARLKLDRHSNRAGHLHEGSRFPEVLEPGSNGAFLHVGNRRDRKMPSKGLLVYCVQVYDDKREEWKDSAFSIAFSWVTEAFGGYVGVKFESARERVLHHTKTKYDGYKIVGEANVKKTPLPVFILTFSQKKVEENDMPPLSKIIDFFQRKRNPPNVGIDDDDEAIEDEGKETEMKDAGPGGLVPKDAAVSEEPDVSKVLVSDQKDVEVSEEIDCIEAGMSNPQERTVRDESDTQYLDETGEA